MNMKAGRFCRRAFSFSGCRESSLPARGGMAVRRSATFQIPKYKVILAHFSRTHTAPRPVHPRALREASLSGTGWRWPRTGATRTPNARRSKPHGPVATGSRHRASCLVRGRAPPRPIAVGRPRQTATAEGVLKTPPTGGRAEQTSNTARGTLERRRTCGSTLRTPVSAEIAVPLRCGDASKPVGPSFRSASSE